VLLLLLPLLLLLLLTLLACSPALRQLFAVLAPLVVHQALPQAHH
jgi:hypothetical protein